MMFAGYELDIGDFVCVSYKELLPWNNFEKSEYTGTVDSTYPRSDGYVGMRLTVANGGKVQIIDRQVIKIHNINRDLLINI